MKFLKEIEFLGDSLESIRRFPDVARNRAGQQLRLVQRGETPADWKPMSTVGAGVAEIRIRDEHGIYRVLYVAKFADAIYVLHAFQKKTQKTDSGDLAIAVKRYKDLKKGQT